MIFWCQLTQFVREEAVKRVCAFNLLVSSINKTAKVSQQQLSLDTVFCIRVLPILYVINCHTSVHISIFLSCDTLVVYLLLQLITTVVMSPVALSYWFLTMALHPQHPQPSTI